MDPQVSASFIPKKPLTNERGSGRGGGSGLLFLLAILIFIASIVAAGVAFAYVQYLKTSIASKSHSLELAQGAYDPGVIQELIRVDSRINQSKILLAKHIAPSEIFSFLADQTLAAVELNGLDYALGADGSAKITFGGVAKDFPTVALQSDQFGSSKVLKDVVFSNITVDATGKVDFSVSATVDPPLLLYSKNISAASASANGGQTDTSQPTQ